ncbi:response regulator [Agitococcus lubricus]|uniref:LuxR family two component transcriptional regulator n=1 Tax=Agitococcus lubricus TaxID=1077255 RepID=A0A2T5J028_9GAMM|nr:response regulator transcription factor [Agitococcus lubricus]PTQ89684.1 LuxR family two component transcriptional regulator [Agitococcus lubricus]
MIRLLVVDDQELVRHGIVALLGFEDDLSVIGQAVDGDDCLSKVAELKPDVILLDIRMPKRNGLDTLRQLRSEQNHTPVILLTTFDEPITMAQGRQLGAQACLLKDIGHSQLTAAIRAVAKGEIINNPKAAAHTVFNRRELAIIRELCAGKQNKEIANALQLSAGTVRNYLSIILEKLEVRDRTQAIIRLRELGLA